jgi:hypothetical protein
MSANHFEPLGPLSADGRAHLGVEIQGHGLPALPVVMVWVPKAITEDPAKLAELKAQTESAVRLEHANIIRVRGLSKLDDGWARVVEFADADSLRKLLEESRGKTDLLWPAIAAALVADACLGVHHAHETGEARDPKRPLLHGGLRPDVLQVNYKGYAKVTGYGASVFAPQGKDAARDAYTAPEQVLGGRDAMTRQTDVYQLGAILYECLAGVPPFTAEEGLLETLILQKMPASHRLGEHPELGEIAMKALAKKASDRYPTALAMREAILASGTPPVSHEVVARWVNLVFPPTHPERVKRRELIREALATTGATAIPEDLAAALAEPPGEGEVRAALESYPVPVPPPAPIPSARPATSQPVRPPVPTPVGEAQYTRRASDRPAELSNPPQPSHLGRNLVLGLVAGGVLAGGVWFYKSNQPPAPQARPEEIHPAVPVPMAAPVDAGEADAGAQDAGSLDGGAPDAGPVDSGPPPIRGPIEAGSGGATATSGAKLSLEIETQPPLSVKIDGEAVGRGSVHATLFEGKHRIEASDRALKIFTARDINLTRDHQHETITIGKAQLAFDVPPGATVSVDGKAIGTAPLEPVTLYAGTHEAVIELNGAKTVQRVPITADFNVTLTVHAQ